MSQKNLKKNKIKNILSDIRKIVVTAQPPSETKYRKGLATQLKENGYEDYFDGEQATTIEAEEVISVLALAINDIFKSFPQKFDIKKLGTENTNDRQKAARELGNRINTTSVEDFLLPQTDWKSLSEAKSPLAFATFLNENKPVDFVKKLIEHQYDIKWATEDGAPEPFNFYEFCDTKQSTECLQYQPRKAHTKVTFYQECPEDLQFSKEELCPDVYMNTTCGWIKWKANGEEHKNLDSLDSALAWMDKDIRDFVSTEAEQMKISSVRSRELREASLKKRVLYLAVMKDNDFREGTELQLKNIGKCQGYVGRARKGIQDRWLENGNSHCNNMKRCLNKVRAMKTYEPSLLEPIQLVDIRLALAKVRNEQRALFVLKTFGDEKEKHEILEDKAMKTLEVEISKSDHGGLQEQFKIYLDTRNRFHEAKDATPNEANAELDRMEKDYRNGIELKNAEDEAENEDQTEGQNVFTWHLKDMRFGMNDK